MDRDLFNGLTTVSLAIVGIGLIAVLVSKNANTGGVLSAYGNMFAAMMTSAEAPVDGSTNNYGMQNSFGG
jgi:drug/metabolite transporter superfamily protein YnfA